jgi:hypothetical protein
MHRIEEMWAEKVARAGFEPATFHFSGERCYQLSYLAVFGGGLRRTPRECDYGFASPATPTGLEPATSAVTGRRANQLRYGAIPDLRCFLVPAKL